jgi:hypothetical protein
VPLRFRRRTGIVLPSGPVPVVATPSSEEQDQHDDQDDERSSAHSFSSLAGSAANPPMQLHYPAEGPIRRYRETLPTRRRRRCLRGPESLRRESVPGCLDSPRGESCEKQTSRTLNRVCEPTSTRLNPRRAARSPAP